MIDLHRLSRHSITGIWWQIKDLAQLMFSSDVEGVTDRDRVRFWKVYRREWDRKPPGAWLLPLVRWKWRLYRRHNEKKPSAVAYNGEIPNSNEPNPKLRKSA